MTDPAKAAPFDIMRATRALAPHDPKLNDMRWLIGEALRRLRVGLDMLGPLLEVTPSKNGDPK